MPVDFQQVRNQIVNLGTQAAQRQEQVRAHQDRARQLLDANAEQHRQLKDKIQEIVRSHDPNLRCASPWIPEGRPAEPLNACFALPETPVDGMLLAADGSQINLDRHAEVMYALINVGAIQIDLSSAALPTTRVYSELLFGESLQTPTGTLNDGLLALRRDVAERRLLAELADEIAAVQEAPAAREIPPIVVTFTDGPLELWGAREAGETNAQEYSDGIADYQEALRRLAALNAATAGYVDKPGANLVVRLLEVATASPVEYPNIREYFPLRDASDRQLFTRRLQPGERSAVFGMQSRSASQYRDEIGLHFFYLNVGRAGNPWLARVEIPGWVAQSESLLNNVHALLFAQAQMMGARPYPYVLHRAHETAVVSHLEREQITAMIIQELHHQGLSPDERSYKQIAKDQPGRTRHQL